MGAREFVRDQSFLAGCMGCVFTSLLVCGGFLALGAVGGFQIVSCAGAGFDSMVELQRDASGAGYAMGFQYLNGERIIHLEPMSARVVTCADLEAIVFPHLTGELETITLTSTSWASQSSPTPLTCSYSGYPTAP
jgi:hypothetical protein